jgi:hypothetical protein
LAKTDGRFEPCIIIPLDQAGDSAPSVSPPPALRDDSSACDAFPADDIPLDFSPFSDIYSDLSAFPGIKPNWTFPTDTEYEGPPEPPSFAFSFW